MRLSKCILWPLLFIAFSAKAEWIQISESISTNIYLDFSTIHTVRGYVRGWTLWDDKKGGSSKQLEEMDCSAFENRTLRYLAYEGSMGEGKMWISNDEPTKFKSVVPGSVGKTVFDIICSASK